MGWQTDWKDPSWGRENSKILPEGKCLLRRDGLSDGIESSLVYGLFHEAFPPAVGGRAIDERDDVR